MNPAAITLKTPNVLRFAQCQQPALAHLLNRYNIELMDAAQDMPILGSFWGDDEAGIIGNKLYARHDTPLHSILHEVCHYICMDTSRRATLHTNAGGGYDEEDAVCYLQIILAEQLDDMGKRKMMQDMDTWGYSFRLGSTQAWFEKDAQEPRQWLIEHDLLNNTGHPSFKVRE